MRKTKNLQFYIALSKDLPAEQGNAFFYPQSDLTFNEPIKIEQVRKRACPRSALPQKSKIALGNSQYGPR
jgi:hypothetical protein